MEETSQALDTEALTWCLCSWRRAHICLSVHGHRGNQLRPRELWAAWGTRTGPGTLTHRQPLRREAPLAPRSWARDRLHSKALCLQYSRFKSWRGPVHREISGQTQAAESSMSSLQPCPQKRPLTSTSRRDSQPGTATRAPGEPVETSGERPQSQVQVPCHEKGSKFLLRQKEATKRNWGVK